MPRNQTTDQIRQGFLNFFAHKGHLIYPSDSILSPDPTLMFSVAGMQQFKPYFLGATPSFGEKGIHYRVTTSQKCVRIGDIENVGRTNRHNSLFEMLGNFSFGDYFKKEAIEWAWEFMTSSDYLGLEPERLYVTIYKDDDEAFGFWTQDVGLPASHIIRFDADENFWPADAPKKGPNGPCGPCSEIYYDRGPAFGSDTWEDYAQNPESGRFLEIWNLVFPQFDRKDGGVLENLPKPNIDTGMGLHRVAAICQDVPDFYDIDIFRPLIDKVVELSGKPYQGEKSVSHRVIADHIRTVSMSIADGVVLSNTGRGYVVRKVLRRASRHAYLLGFKEPVLHKLVQLVVDTMGHVYPEVRENQANIENSIRLEEDRFLKTLESGIERLNTYLSCAVMKKGISFTLSNPDSNTGIIFVMGRFRNSYLSKAVTIFDGKVDQDEFTKLMFSVHQEIVNELNDEKSSAYKQGMIVAFDINQSYIFTPAQDNFVLDGRDAFTLYDTYGFPLDLTEEIALEHGITVDREGFNQALKEQQERARAASKYGKMELFGEVVGTLEEIVRAHGATEFVGYDSLEVEGAKVLGILQDNESVGKISGSVADLLDLSRSTKPERVSTVILDTTPFYAEGGGQVGDVGVLEWGDALEPTGSANVLNTRKTPQGLFLHEVQVMYGTLESGATVRARVSFLREATERHHTATHLLHAALRAVLGAGVAQRGSLVAPDRLRFDFSQNEPMTREQMGQVENLVNRWIQADFPVTWRYMPIDEARATGAMALFGEKYGDTVRVVSVDGSVALEGAYKPVGDILTAPRETKPVTMVSSKELCGGCHVTRTGEIGTFVLVSEEGTAAGVRRLEALTGESAVAFVRQQLETLNHASHLINSKPLELVERIGGLQAQIKDLGRELEGLKRKLAEAQMGGGSSQDVRELGGFRVAVAQLTGVEAGALRDAADSLMNSSSADIAIVGSDGALAIKVSKDGVARGAHAGQLIGKLAAAGGGKGGGRPDMAQAGGKDVGAAIAALEGAL